MAEEIVQMTPEEYDRLQKGATRKCESHYGSKIWRGVSTGLVIYAIVMHSFFIGKLEEIEGTLVRKAKEEAKAESVAAIQKSVSQWKEAQASALQTQRRASENELGRLTDLLHQAEALHWTLTTPENERDAQLKQALDALKP